MVSSTMGFSIALFCALFFVLLLVNGGWSSNPIFEDLKPLDDDVSNKHQPYRTSYHFQSPQNWLNDPNGPMCYNGVYHLFYQYNPSGPVFGDIMVWAHSVSYDLINWIHLEHALYPTDPFDINSCWSGSATILPDNKPVILYTGIDSKKHQVQNLATPKNLSDPFLREWVKYSKNPIMIPPDRVEPDNFRDPTTAWKGSDGKWRVIVGGHNRKYNRGMAMLYISDDFFHWTEYKNPLYSSEVEGMWECPDFYPVYSNGTNGVDIGDLAANVKYVMKASFNAHDYYVLGTYNDRKESFSPDTHFTGTFLDLRYDYGKFYASKTFFDNIKSRRILWGWVNESDSTEDDIRKGWSGLQSIPRQIWLHTSGKQLVQWPIQEVDTLRREQVSIRKKKLQKGSVVEVSGVTASQVDVEVVFALPNLEGAEFIDTNSVDPVHLCDSNHKPIKNSFGPFGLYVLATKDLTERTAIFFKIFRGHNKYVVLMCSDQSRSSLKNDMDKSTYGALIDMDPPYEKISLRSLIDHSIVENFAVEGRACITSRVYPKLAINGEAHLFAFNNGTANVTISTLKAWTMNKALINSQDTVI